MTELIIKNNFTYLNNSNLKITNLLVRNLRYRPEGYFFSPLYKSRRWDGYIKMFTKNSQVFQTGLLPKVINLFNENNIEYKLIDERKKPVNTIYYNCKQKLPELRQYQKEAVTNFVKAHRGIINIPTGTGKTLCAIEIIKELGVRALYICPNTVIMRQTGDILATFFGQNKVGLVYGKEKKITNSIVVACVDSLPNFPKEIFDQFDLLIIDEFHHASADTFQELNKKKFENIYYRLGLTATHYRNDGSEMKMDAVLSEVIYSMPIKNAIKNNYLVEPYFFIKKLQLPNINFKTYQQNYKNLIVENEERNNEIVKMANICLKKEWSTLILVKEIKHGKKLESIIPESIFIHGNHSDRENIIEDFKNGKQKLVISTNIIGEGTDIPILQALIMGQAMKAEGDLVQKIGRTLRIYDGKEKAYIFDIKDEGNKIFEKQALSRIKAYKKNYTNKIHFV